MKNNTQSQSSVTIIGLGPMGQAMARTLLNHGYGVTLWNRTASKANELIDQGAIRASTIKEALNASEVVILSLTDYNAMYAILENASDILAGKVFVNLSSDTPEKPGKQPNGWPDMALRISQAVCRFLRRVSASRSRSPLQRTLGCLRVPKGVA